jgi:hypothetical protein
VNKYENKEFVELNVSMSINLFKSVELIRKGLMKKFVGFRKVTLLYAHAHNSQVSLHREKSIRKY